MEKGILMFCVGHSTYGKMAATLAATIKVNEDIPIALLWQGEALGCLTDKEKALFDMLIPLDDKYVHNKDGSFNPIKARLYFYELTPFLETLCLDVDNLWLNKKKPSEVFEELKDVYFTIQNAGYTICDAAADPYFSIWADISEVTKAYNLEGKRFYKTFGEWIYFKKDPIAKKFFSESRKIFLSKPKCKVHGWMGQAVPDELAFSIAMAKNEIYPHVDEYHPTTYYHITSRGQFRYYQPYQLAEKYYTISAGGLVHEYTIRNCNILSEAAYQKMGMKNYFRWTRKKSFINESKIA